MASVYPEVGVNALILANTPVTYLISSNDNALVNQIVADVTGASTAEANLLTQEQAAMKVNAVFEVVASEAQAIAILNAFNVESNDPTSSTASITATMEATGSAHAIAFRSALAALVDAAATGTDTQTHGKLAKGLGAGVGQTSNMVEYFAELIRGYVNADLAADGFNNLLEAGLVSKINTTVGHVAAAADMYTQMLDVNNEVKLTNLVRQNDERDMEEYYAYIKEDSNTSDVAHFAPMKGGKTMTFIFDAQLSDPSSIKLKYVGTSAGGNGYLTDPAGIKDRTIVSASGGTLHADEARIAIIVQMDSKDNYFVRDVSQNNVLETSYTGSVATPADFAAAAKFYREAYLNKDTGFALASSFSAYTLTSAPTAAVTKADALALGYWQAVGQYVAARSANSAVKLISAARPTIA